MKGWNWGKGEFGKAELAFSVQNRPAFEIPYSEVSNTNLAGKNEVAVEFSLPAGGNETGTNGHMGGARTKGRKSGAGKDQLVEMRFYIPGTATKRENDDDGEDKSMDGSEGEEQHNAANLFYETLMDKAEIGEVAGDTFATFLEVLHLTPRGRFGIDMYEASFRLRGKTYDYKIPYDNIKKFMLLPKPDDLHTLITIGLDPPLRQGQTRYPFLVMQFKREEEVTIELNMTKCVRYLLYACLIATDCGQRVTGREIQRQTKCTLRTTATHSGRSSVSWVIRQKDRSALERICQVGKGIRFWRRLCSPFKSSPTIRSQMQHQSQRRASLLLGQEFHVCPQARHIHTIRQHLGHCHVKSRRCGLRQPDI